MNIVSKKICLAKCSDSGLKKKALKDECITNCRTDDGSYLAVDTFNCVSSCAGNLGSKFKTSSDLEKCLYPFESCLIAGEFADDTTNYLCTACNTVLTNCLKCTSSKVCTECDSGSKLVYASAT